MAMLLLLGTIWLGTGEARGSPTLWGYTGLINIPTADLVPDGLAVVGTGYVQRPYGVSRCPGHDNATYYAALGFFPFLEVNMRVTRICGSNLDRVLDRYGSDKDRSVGIRVRVLEQRAGRPSVLIGLHDPSLEGAGLGNLSNSGFSAFYVAGSKRVGRVGLHAGYAVDWLLVRSPHFIGLFGGVECAATRWLAAMAEYDTHKSSAGIRCAIPLRRAIGSGYGAQDAHGALLGFDVVSLGLKKISGGIYVQFGL